MKLAMAIVVFTAKHKTVHLTLICRPKKALQFVWTVIKIVKLVVACQQARQNGILLLVVIRRRIAILIPSDNFNDPNLCALTFYQQQK